MSEAGSTALDPRIRAKIEQLRLIFTVTTGRSGSNYLARLLAGVDGVTGHHEPQSQFSALMRLVQTDPDIATRFWTEIKLPEIALTRTPVYAETSHVFCKGFFHPLLDLGFVPDLVVLTRNHRKVARSIFLLGEIPGDSNWYLSPGDPGVKSWPDWRNMNDYERAYWYCLEIERRAEAYSSTVKSLGGRVSAINLEELNTPGGRDRMLSELDLPPIARWRLLKMEVTGRVVNRKSKKKRLEGRRKQLADLDLPALEKAVDQRFAAAETSR